MSRSGIVNVRMVITEEKILSNMDKVQKLINPNSKKQIIQLEEDAFFKDLIERNYIVCFNKDGKNVYQITDLGKATLDLTHDMIPGIIKLKVDTSFSGELKETAQKESITAEYTPKSENEYTVTCKINENNSCIFEISVFAGSREEAKRIVDNWKENAYRIYPEILNSLSN